MRELRITATISLAADEFAAAEALVKAKPIIEQIKTMIGDAKLTGKVEHQTVTTRAAPAKKAGAQRIASAAGVARAAGE